MGKIVRAVAPFRHKGIVNFKREAYDAWVRTGGSVAPSHYLPGMLSGWFYNHELPMLPKSKREARLRFVEPISRKFDAFPDYVRYEIIPMIWDCWPCLDNRLSVWLTKHGVKSAIFTSEQAAERIQKRFPEMAILVITEGVDVSLHYAGKPLKDRSIDVLEFGRTNRVLLDDECLKGLHCLCSGSLERRLTDEELYQMMGDAKIAISLPKCDTDAEIGNGQETLTQRYWENMLSRILMVGHAPKELVDLIGYNPCIELDGFVSHRGLRNYRIEALDAEVVNKQITSIVLNIADYQGLVDRNREVALKMAPWDIRMKQVTEWLEGLGYEVQTVM